MVLQFDFEDPLDIVPQDQFILTLDFESFENGMRPNTVIKRAMVK